jgi:hypothetical protein
MAPCSRRLPRMAGHRIQTCVCALRVTTGGARTRRRRPGCSWCQEARGASPPRWSLVTRCALAHRQTSHGRTAERRTAPSKSSGGGGGGGGEGFQVVGLVSNFKFVVVGPKVPVVSKARRRRR